MLTNSPKILHITKRDFLQLNCFQIDNKYGKGAVVMLSTVLGPVYYVASRKVLLNANFRAFI